MSWLTAVFLVHPPNKIHIPRKISEPCLWFLLRSKSRMLSAIGEEGNRKPPHKVHSLEKLKAQSLVSFVLEIEYATQFLAKQSTSCCSGVQHFVRPSLLCTKWQVICLREDPSKQFYHFPPFRPHNSRLTVPSHVINGCSTSFLGNIHR